MAAGIIDVAHRANVSVSPGSHCLNRRPDRMAPATQDKVERAVEDDAASPSRAARRLRTGRSDIIGLAAPVATRIEGLSPSPRNLIFAPERMVREPMAGLRLTE
ncbi:LacI family DNA-binding transcriptional regulator [Bosea caraganae]|uniref:LacI family DNA-binding transcriptional regulator n=1 Tax=Bosea caraganae TaxID=2763117 RepID=A0A370LAA2_9HYPH|nr:LacI family DNA-binding transcriptional regulator [Bosea caraganae]RDJ21838.1 LacI family DNA-binding transcriptional regulator [Bosea caraganae]RDJ28131.1 LacI family DNA-binding transcriptional regulator [Bosea caraganae]